MVKVGNQLFTAEGPSVVRSLARMGFGIFLDLKFHDIPNTVGHGVASACRLPGVRLLTLHTLGAAEMMVAARRAADSVKHPPKLLGVTLLTSHTAGSIRSVGIAGPPSGAGGEAGAIGEGLRDWMAWFLRRMKFAQFGERAGRRC